MKSGVGIAVEQPPECRIVDIGQALSCLADQRRQRLRLDECVAARVLGPTARADQRHENGPRPDRPGRTYHRRASSRAPAVANPPARRHYQPPADRKLAAQWLGDRWADQLSSEIHASARTALIEDSRFLRDAVGDRLRTADTGFAIWRNGFGSWGHWGSDGNAARLNRSVNGFTLGADALVLGTARLGVVGSYGRASLDSRARASSGARDSYELGIYGGAELGAAAVRVGVSHGWHQLETTRLVVFPGFTDSLRGEQDAQTTQVYGELAYRIALGAASVEPFADFAHVRVNTDSMTEKGGAAALRAASADSGTSFTTLGLRAAPSFSLGSANLTARGALGWRHAFGDGTPLSAMQFANGGDSFRIGGIPIARNAAAFDAGIDVALTSGRCSASPMAASSVRVLQTSRCVPASA